MNEFMFNKAMYLLRHGYILHVNAAHGGGEIWMPEDGEYFRYRYFGTSAVKATERKLWWLFEAIFKTSDYVAFSNWHDVNLNYNAKDDRGMWIFTDGDYPRDTAIASA